MRDLSVNVPSSEGDSAFCFCKQVSRTFLRSQSSLMIAMSPASSPVSPALVCTHNQSRVLANDLHELRMPARDCRRMWETMEEAIMRVERDDSPLIDVYTGVVPQPSNLAGVN
jgi:hypothetical protein